MMLPIAAGLFALGLLMRHGRGLMLLAGYNALPKEERDKVDKAALGRAAGALLVRLGLALGLLGVAIWQEWLWGSVLLLAVILVDPCVATVRMSRWVPMTAASRGGLIATCAVVTVALVSVAVMLHFGEAEPAVSVSAGQIHIAGMYGVVIALSDVSDVILLDQSMEIIGVGRRTNGYGGFGSHLKGHFDSVSLGKHLLFVDAGSPPTLRIERSSEETIYLSFADGQKTEALYQELMAALPAR